MTREFKPVFSQERRIVTFQVQLPHLMTCSIEIEKLAAIDITMLREAATARIAKHEASTSLRRTDPTSWLMSNKSSPRP
jgi:hypothetical protein